MDAGVRGVAARDRDFAACGRSEIPACIRRDGCAVKGQGGIGSRNLVHLTTDHFSLASSVVIGVEAVFLVCARLHAQQRPSIVGVVVLREQLAEPRHACAFRVLFQRVDVVSDGGAEHLGEVEIV